MRSRQQLPKPTLLSLLLIFVAVFTQPLVAQTLDGTWQGTLGGPPGGLRVVLHISAKPGDPPSAEAFSIDQGPDPMHVDTVAISGQQLNFSIKAIGGSYTGILQPEGNSIHGTWNQGAPLPLNFVRATAATKWAIDPSPHTVSFITVAPNVRVEVLDWGGTGRPLVLLAGLGNTAHAFDRFAPKLTPKYHVYGITRRGFGASSVPPPDNPANYTADRLGDDVLAVLDAVHLAKPVLIGHSIAGEELSSINARYPQRVAGLVYLEAGFGYALYNPARGDYLIDLIDLQKKLSQLLPGASSGDPSIINTEVERSLPQFQRDLQEQSEQRAVMPHPPAPESGPPPPPSPSTNILLGQQKYTHLSGPILAIFAVPHTFADMYANDPKALAAARDFDTKRMTAIAGGFAKDVSTAKVVQLNNADHFIFESNEPDVLRSINTFLEQLP